jgi:hypothetical protein
VPLGRNRAGPSCTARVRPTATRGMAHARGTGAAHGLGRRSVRGPAQPARAVHGARRRCSASQRRHGTGAREMAEERVAHRRRDGGVARRRRASGGRHGDGRCRRLQTVAVGTAAWSGRRRGRRGERRAARVGRDDGARGEAAAAGAVGTGLSGRAARCADSGLKARASGATCGSHAATARCRVDLARRTVSNRWGPLVSDF